MLYNTDPNLPPPTKKKVFNVSSFDHLWILQNFQVSSWDDVGRFIGVPNKQYSWYIYKYINQPYILRRS